MQLEHTATLFLERDARIKRKITIKADLYIPFLLWFVFGRTYIPQAHLNGTSSSWILNDYCLKVISGPLNGFSDADPLPYATPRLCVLGYPCTSIYR